MEICDASKVLRDDASTVGKWHEGCSPRQATVEKGAGGSSGGRRGDLNCSAGRDSAAGGSCRCSSGSHGQCWEGGDGQVGSGWARGDEASCECEDSADTKRGVECRWDGGLLGGCANEGLMTSLNGDDLSGHGQDSRRLYERCGSEISAFS